MREYIINSSVRSSDNIKGEKGVISSIENVSNKVKRKLSADCKRIVIEFHLQNKILKLQRQ